METSVGGTLCSDNFTRAILQFWNTLDPSTKSSSAEIVFGRPLRDALPIQPPMQLHDFDSVKPSWKKREETLKSRAYKQLVSLSLKSHQLDPLEIGDTCKVQNQTGRFPKNGTKLALVLYCRKLTTINYSMACQSSKVSGYVSEGKRIQYNRI